MIFSTYLTKKREPQGQAQVEPNRSSLIFNWYRGIDEGVIFHDELSESFQARYPKVKFIKINNYDWSANDERFRMFRDYLWFNPSIKTLWMTDLFDVTVRSIPKISDHDDRLFVSNENKHWIPSPWCRHLFERAGKLSFEDSGLEGKIIYNPGVWGGSREVVFKILNEIIDMMETFNVKEKNLNMLIFNLVVHNYPQYKIATGYPLHSKFKAFEEDSKAHFIHK